MKHTLTRLDINLNHYNIFWLGCIEEFKSYLKANKLTRIDRKSKEEQNQAILKFLGTKSMYAYYKLSENGFIW